MNTNFVYNFGGTSILWGSILPYNLTNTFSLTVFFCLLLGLISAYSLEGYINEK